MTEYDFSPEAHERYMHTQQRIASWVDQTEEYRPQFGSAVAPSSQHGTPPMHSRPRHQRHHSEFERRRPSFSSSSDSSSSSSTDDSGRRLGTPGPMPAFQPMYLQHPVVDPPHSGRFHRSDPHRPHDKSSHSSHRASPPSSHFTAPSLIYGYSSGHDSSGMTSVRKDMSFVVGHLLLPLMSNLTIAPRPHHHHQLHIIYPRPRATQIPDTPCNKMYTSQPSPPVERFLPDLNINKDCKLSPFIQAQPLGRAPVHSIRTGHTPVLLWCTHSRVMGYINPLRSPRYSINACTKALARGGREAAGGVGK
jgi:hypothetical protein